MALGRGTAPVTAKLGTTEFSSIISSLPAPAASVLRDVRARADFQARLVRLGSERLAELILEIAGRQGAAFRRALDEALRKFPDTMAPSHAEDAQPYMVGSSPAMQTVYSSIRKFAATNAAVLITGESGTGKELVARAVHERSVYRAGPFVAVNCGALPATLIAAELFGHEKGAFTGAVQRRIGRLESAHRGTIFLDEIGDLPLELQAHLLRFLQERTIDRVGGSKPIEVDARVICATNLDLAKAVREGRFREDLYYRLNVLSLRLPALRDRGDDIELLATFFLRKFAAEHGRTVAGFSDDARQRIREHSWPGNVRELIGRLRRAIVMAEGALIDAPDIGLDATAPAARAVPAPARRGGPLLDEATLRQALQRHRHNVSNVARALDVSRMTVYRSLRRYNIP
jgi:DNA-binding NtrC family response regulator